MVEFRYAITVPRRCWKLTLTEQIPAISSPTVHLKPVLNDPGSEASLDLIRVWMRNCLERHGNCRQESLPRLPTRVIDVSSTNLHIRETHGEKGLYMALSHCWGQERGLMLTQENLQVLTTKINIAALPKSIQHANILARNLGVDSLWIDTLCIIQDSLQDWARESSSMCDVYCNSHLTIVAAGSPSDAQGFLDRRDDFPPTTAPSCPAKILSRRNPHSGPREPLYNRAWTFQERLLSPRMIKFKRHELEWHCRTRKVCECGHYTADATPYNDAYNNMFRDWGSRQQVYDFWRLNIVQSYSRLHLTNPSDRLPALSGLATMVGRRFPELEYLSGLWAGDVVQGLQWYRDMGAEQSEDPQTLRFAPTWSWASILGPVTYPSRSRDQAHGTALASLRGYGYEGAGVDVHGEVKPGGWLLLLFAPVLQLRALVTSFGPGDTQFTYCFVQNQHSSAIRVGPGTAGKLQYYPDCARDPFGVMQMQGSGMNCAAGAGKERVVAGEKVWVPTVVLEAEEQSDGKARICRCLVLVVDSSDSTAFTRVGYLVFEDVHGWLEGAEYSAVRII
ncbi:hypothetical protein J1614_008918 [Plenodomus biglobosus]|nr:hypothetical protein J1614_008918 [Plenodomus biglobosus]